jgi:hypothetical protein
LIVSVREQLQRWHRENKKKAKVTALYDGVDVESTRFRFSTRSALKWRGFMLGPKWQSGRKREMSKQSMREETERLVKEAMERKTVAVKQGKTRIDAICGKCGAPNRVSAAPGEVRVAYTCRECGDKQKTL